MNNILKHLIESYLPTLSYIFIFVYKMDDHVKQIHFQQKKMLKNNYKNYEFTFLN